MRRRVLDVLGVAALVLSSGAVAEVAGVDSAETSFKGTGPAGFKIEGKTSKLQVKRENDTLVLTVPLADLDTGIGLRNRHMREKYLEVPKYPVAELKVKAGAVRMPEPGQSTRGELTAPVTIHGQTKEVPVKYELRREGDLLKVQGSFPINIKDFGISVPSYLGITVKPDMSIESKFTARVSGEPLL